MMIQGNMKKWFVLVALAFVMVVAEEVWGIRAASAAPTYNPVKHRTLRMMMHTEPTRGLNRLMVTGPAGDPIWVNVLEPLADMGGRGEMLPKLATKWEHSADLTKWRFYLRKGVKFHNGANFTARDVVDTANYLIELKAEGSAVYAQMPVKSAVAIDDYTVDLNFENPQPLLPVRICWFLIYPTAIAKDNREIAKTQVIGTGPYKFIEWKRGISFKLTKFEGYWGPKPQIDDVQIIVRAESAVRLSALLAGEGDWIYGIAPEEASQAPKLIRIPGPETVRLQFDESVQKNPIFADKRLRLAVDYALDRQALIKIEKYGSPSRGQFAAPGDFGFNPDLKSRPYDLEKAVALVKEAGAVGKTVTFVGATDRWPAGREIAEAIAYMIEKTGLKVNLMLMPQIESDKYQRSTPEHRGYMRDLHITASDHVYEVESRFVKNYVEGGPFFALNDLEPTKFYKEKLSPEVDFAKRGEGLAKIYAYLYEQAHYLPVYRRDWLWGAAKNLEWQPDRGGRPFVSEMRFTD